MKEEKQKPLQREIKCVNFQIPLFRLILKVQNFIQVEFYGNI